MSSQQDRNWIQYLNQSQKDLVNQSYVLFEREQKSFKSGFTDYSFIVFPMAKAYEGFLKEFLYNLGVISKASLESDHFRIGKSLNPDLPIKYRRNNWVVDRLDKRCDLIMKDNFNSSKLSLILWKAWKNCRNSLFHYFPTITKPLSLSQASSRLQQLADAINIASTCQVLAKNRN